MGKSDIIHHIRYINNCFLELKYVPSSDEASRSLSKADATLTLRTLYVCYLFGLYMVDIFSLDSNSMTDLSGRHLCHFTPFPIPLTAGVNAFAQMYFDHVKYFAFP